MQDTTENALVEISLALAMAFFALLIVALVSMATPSTAAATAEPGTTPAVPELELALGGAARDAATPLYLFRFGDRWFGENAEVLDPRTLHADGRRLVVALAPDVTLADAQGAQREVTHLDADVTLTTLSPEWLARLEDAP